MNEEKTIRLDRMRYTKNSLASGLALLAIPSYFANELIPDVDYLYVKLAIPFMPEGQLPRMMVYFVIIVLLFHGMWLILNACAPKKKEAAR